LGVHSQRPVFQEKTLREDVIELIQTQKQQGKRIFFLANVYDITWFESVYPQLMEILMVV